MQKTAFFSFVLIGLAFVSCKKTYTCDCVTTNHHNNGSGSVDEEYKNTSMTYSEKMSEKQAKSACDHEAEAINSAYSNYWTNNGTVNDPNFSTTTNCALK